MQATVKFVLRESKSKEKHIALRIIFQRKAKYLHTKHQIHPKYWDETTGNPKPSYPRYKGLIEDLTIIWSKVVRKLNDGMSPQEILDELKTPVISDPVASNIKIKDYFLAFIKDLDKQGRDKYASVFDSTYKMLLRFSGNDLTFQQINYKYLVDFDAFMIKEGLQSTSRFVYLRHLRVVCNKIIKEKLLPRDWYPFTEFSLGKYQRVKTLKRAITSDEFSTFEAYQPTTTKEILAQNIFLFSFYCRGINFKDIALLTRNNIQGDRLIYVRSKTKDKFSLKLLEPAKEILSYYMERQRTNEYIFPILNSKLHVQSKTIFHRINSMNGQINRMIQCIAKKQGIQAHITTYVARHSFATILYKKGVRVSMISEMLGHETEEITRVYLKSFGNEELDDAVEKLL